LHLDWNCAAVILPFSTALSHAEQYSQRFNSTPFPFASKPPLLFVSILLNWINFVTPSTPFKFENYYRDKIAESLWNLNDCSGLLIESNWNENSSEVNWIFTLLVYLIFKRWNNKKIYKNEMKTRNEHNKKLNKL